MGSFLIIFSALGFGVMPIFAIYAYESGMNVPTLLFFRFLFASLLFFIYLGATRKKWSITKRHIFLFFLLGGILYTAQAGFYFSSVQFIPASLAALLLYLYPIIVAILSFFVNKERFSMGVWISIIISLIGMLFVLGAPSGELNLIGILLALGAALTYSIYIIVSNRITHQVDPVVMVACITFFAALSFFIWGTTTSSFHFNFIKMGWLPLLGITLFSTVGSMFTFFAGMKRVGPTKASVVSMIEPVVTILFSAILLSEKMTFVQLMGAIVVVGATIYMVLAREQVQKGEVTEEINQYI